MGEEGEEEGEREGMTAHAHTSTKSRNSEALMPSRGSSPEQPAIPPVLTPVAESK